MTLYELAHLPGRQVRVLSERHYFLATASSLEILMEVPSVFASPVTFTVLPAFAASPATVWFSIWKTLPPLTRTYFYPDFAQAIAHSLSLIFIAPFCIMPWSDLHMARCPQFGQPLMNQRDLVGCEFAHLGTCARGIEPQQASDFFRSENNYSTKQRNRQVAAPLGRLLLPATVAMFNGFRRPH
jgi:hypothetical protein